MYRANEKIALYEEDRQLNDHKARHHNAIKLDFDLTDEDLSLLNAIYAPCVIHPTPGRPAPAHPIAAAQQRIAYQAAYRWAKPRLSEGLIEIGPNPANFAKIAIEQNYATTHGCTKPDGRDETRYMTAEWSIAIRTCRDQQYRQNVQQLRLSQPTNKFCVNGFGNCLFNAPNAISIHSLYDISLQELALGFYNHGTEQLRAWMHLPYELLQVDQWTNKTHQFTFHCKRVNGKKRVVFGFLNDPSFMYEHDYDTWTAYMTTSCFNTPYGFALLIERTKQNGTQCELKITKVALRTTVTHTIPTGLSKIIAVPNLSELAKLKFCSKAKVTYFHTDALKVEKLRNFLLARENKGFTFITCLAYARSLKSQVKVGQQVYEESWDVGIEFDQLCLSIFIMVEFERRMAAETLTRAFFHMERASETQSFFDKFFDKLYNKIFPRHIHEIKESISPQSNGILSDNTQSRNHFCNMAFKFFDDLTFCGNSNQSVIQTPCVVPALEPELQMPFDAPKGKRRIDGETPQWLQEIDLLTGAPIPLSFDWSAVDHQQLFVNALETSITSTTAEILVNVFNNAKYAIPSGDANDPNWKNVALLTGPPGSGKSSHIRRTLFTKTHETRENVLYITPSRALRDEMRDKTQYNHVKIHTVHTAMSYAAQTLPAYIIIDECFTFPSAIIAWFTSLSNHPRILLLGDPNQIPHIDFENCWFDDVPLADITPFLLHHVFDVTYRCPADIAALGLLQHSYPGLSSKSAVKTSVEFITDKPALFHKSDYQHLSFTQSGKEHYTNQKYNSCTVHEAQGRTFKNVILHFNTTAADLGLVRKSPNHLIVAVTRHTDKLYICDETNGTINQLLIDDTKVSIPLANSGVDIQAMPERDDRVEICTSERFHQEKLPYPTCHATMTSASIVLQNAFPMQPLPEYQAILDRTIPQIHARATLRTHALGKDELYESKPHTVYSFPDPQRVKVTRSTDQRMSLISVAKRLGAKTKNLSDVRCATKSKHLFGLIEKEFDFALNDDDLRLCYFDAVQRFTARGHDLTDLLNISDWNDQSVRMVKNFLKAQQKPSTTSDPLAKAKAGQGISAWSKTLNFQITIWTRYLEFIMTRQSKGKVFIATGLTDEEMMAYLESKHTQGSKMFENDWTEFDSSQNNLTHAILGRALKKIRCPAFIRDQFLEQIANRRVVDDFLTIEVQDKKDSGAPHTLIDNCLFNLAIHLDILSNVEMLAIKGDDVLADGPGLLVDKLKMAKYHEECGYKFKPAFSNSCGFVSFIVNDLGSAYDLPRLASKVLSRNYLSYDDYLNYQEALSVTLAPVTTEVGINMVKVNALHHNVNYKTRVNEADMDILLSFLKRFTANKIPFEHLISKESSTLYCDPDPAVQINYKVPHLYGKLPSVAGCFKNAAIAAVALLD